MGHIVVKNYNGPKNSDFFGGALRPFYKIHLNTELAKQFLLWNITLYRIFV